MNLQSIDIDALLALHDECVAQYGGEGGLRHPAALEAALAYPLECALSGQELDIAALAAAHAFGIVSQRPFRTGNIRAAFLALGLFLYINGWRLGASDSEIVEAMLEVAAGQLDQPALAEWMRARL